MLKTWFEITLWKRIMGMLMVGIVVGAMWGPGAENISWMGGIFINLIQMVVVPLVFFTLVSGIIAMGDPKKLGSLGARTLGMYIVTTMFAIIIGLTLAILLQPGIGVDLGTATRNFEEAKPLVDRLLEIIPKNPVAALADRNMLAIIFFSLMLGAAILMTGKKAKPVANVFESGSEVMLRVTHMVMEVAPFGVFALIAGMVGTGGITKLFSVVPLVVAVVGGCFIHMIVVHGSVMKFILKLPAIRFFQGARGAQLVAFSTSSSSGTLPVTIAAAEDNLGIKTPVAASVLPLGSTINMDGTAIYVSIVAVFAAQAIGIPLGLTEYLMIAGATTLVSIGTAAVPSASLFMMTSILPVIGITDVQTALVVGFLFPFDRPLDMLRTVVNVTGDLSVATAVAKWEDELDEDSFRAAPIE